MIKVELTKRELDHILFALKVDYQTVTEAPDEWQPGEVTEISALLDKLEKLGEKSNE